jgi:hypothetical protein
MLFALSAYSAGQANVDEWRLQGKGIAFVEYVDSVLKTRDIYAHAYREELGLR